MHSQKMVDNVDKFAEGEDLDNSIIIESSQECPEKLDCDLDKIANDDLDKQESADKEANDPAQNDDK